MDLMNLVVILIFILVVYIVYILKNKNKSNKKNDLSKQYIAPKNNNHPKKSIQLDDDFINSFFDNKGNLKEEYVIDPSDAEDNYLRSFMTKLQKERYFGHIMGPFKFKTSEELVDEYDNEDDDEEEVSMYSNEYDYDTQTNVFPFKKHFLMISIPKDDFLDLRKSLKKIIIDGKKQINRKEFKLNIDACKVDNYYTLWIGVVSVYLENSKILIGHFNGSNIEMLWKNFEDFIDNKKKIHFF